MIYHGSVNTLAQNSVDFRQDGARMRPSVPGKAPPLGDEWDTQSQK